MITDGHREAYFKGRKLKGKEVKVPEGFKGTIVKRVETKEQSEKELERQEEDENGVEEKEEVEVLNAIGSFDDIVLWGHDTAPPEDDAFVKGMGEWIRFAEAVRFQRANCFHR